MPAAPMVRGAKRRAPNSPGGNENRDSSPCGAAPGTKQSNEPGDLPGARPEISQRQTPVPIGLSAAFTPNDSTPHARICLRPNGHVVTSRRSIVRTGLRFRAHSAGQSAFAVLGVNEQETQASIDAALTFGILWMDSCRKRHSDKFMGEGLKLFVPAACSALTRERMAHLHAAAAKWHLYELEVREDDLREIDFADRGNVKTRLTHFTNESVARERFADPIAKIQQLMPESEIAVLSSSEIAFRCHGLEFARARLAHDLYSFQSRPEIVFGVGSRETVLNEHNAKDLRQIVCSMGEVRHSDGPRDHPLWRLHSERWLESLVVQQLAALDGKLDPEIVYSQVPAFSASDRAMIDVLSTTRDGRLAVVELKADEDIHLPLQGLDYWSRVDWHHSRGEFQQFGYFSGRELSSESPLLLLVAPALHVHPATDTLLKSISPKIEWTLIGIDERWREHLRVIFRKNPRRSDSREVEQNAA